MMTLAVLMYALCRYALLSSPDSGCNPTADENDGSQWVKDDKLYYFNAITDFCAYM